MTKQPDTVQLATGDWLVECLPDDGGRLGRLSYRGVELVNTKPRPFRQPKRNFGRYETRRSTVMTIVSRVSILATIRVSPGLCRIMASFAGCRGRCAQRPAASSAAPAASGCARLRAHHAIRWRHTHVDFHGGEQRRDSPAFLHVMHAMLPLQKITGLTLPGFKSAAFETETKAPLPANDSQAARFLLKRPAGSATMLILRGIAAGRFAVTLAGLTLNVEFPRKLFPALGIWWNHAGYPDESGLQRSECGLEPLSGPWSSLARSCAEGGGLCVPAKRRLTWTVKWTIEEEKTHAPNT